MTNSTLDRTLSRLDRQKLSAMGLVLTTALLLVMAGVAAGNASRGDQMARVDTGTVKAEMLDRTIVASR